MLWGGRSARPRRAAMTQGVEIAERIGPGEPHSQAVSRERRSGFAGAHQVGPTADDHRPHACAEPDRRLSVQRADLGECRDPHTDTDFLIFLRRVAHRYRDRALHVILANSSTHTTLGSIWSRHAAVFSRANRCGVASSRPSGPSYATSSATSPNGTLTRHPSSGPKSRHHQESPTASRSLR